MERHFSLPVSPPRLPRTQTSMVPLAEFPGSGSGIVSRLSAPQASLLPAYGHGPAVRVNIRVCLVFLDLFPQNKITN